MSEINSAQALILRILGGFRRPLYRTKLVKLAYLIDYTYYRNFGRTLSGLQYEWDQFGPNAVGNAIVIEAEELTRKDVISMERTLNPYGERSYLYRLRDREAIPTLKPEQEYIVEQVLKQYSGLAPNRLAALSKRTKPFRNAKKYSVLLMEQDTPAELAASEGLEEHEAEVAQKGTKSLQQIKAKYGLT